MDGGDTTTRRPTAPAAIGRVLGLSLSLSTAAAALAWVLAGSGVEPSRHGNWTMVALVAVGFAVAKVWSFHVEYRREAHSFSMSDVPAALALAFLGPLVAIVVRVVVSVVVMRARWRTSPLKLFFNASLFAFETALAFTIVRAITDLAPDDDGVLLIAIAAGLAVSNLLGSVFVSLAISCFEGRPLERIANQLRTTVLVGPTLVLIATVSVAPVLIRPELTLLALVPSAVGWLVLRQYGRLSQHHRDLQAVHGFAGVTGRSLGLDEVTETAVREAARLLRAGRAALYAIDEDGRLAAAGAVDTDLCDGPALPFSDHLDDLAADRATDCTLTESGNVTFDERPNAIAVPLRDDDGLLGVLIAADRSGAGVGFDDADRTRAVTLCEQLAANLRKALLHRRMEYAALHDVLTGEPNRHAFEQALLCVDPRSPGATGVLMLDVNRFKEINDTLGHHNGDRVLQEFARRVKHELERDDVFARFSGDEFAILVRRPTFEQVEALGRTIREESFRPICIDELDVVATTSVGVVEVDVRDLDPTEILRRADVALYTAKRDHTNVEVYRSDIDRRNPERLSLLGGLRDALVNGGLDVHYQPKVDLQTSTVTSAEALVRWQHPTRGWISPEDFVRLAEESGLIKQLTDFVLASAIAQAQQWSDMAYDITVAVNLSTHDLLDELLPHRIERLLTENGTPPERLTLEITESALLADTPRTTSTIQRLSALGVRLSLDDFGTGYSSLSYLRRLPVGELKVDQSFVKNLLLDEQDAVIVRSTIDLGHNLGLQVVAEGIENEPVLERLRGLGCDIGQGYGISRPLAPEHFMTWLATTDYRITRRAADIWT